MFKNIKDLKKKSEVDRNDENFLSGSLQEPLKH